MANVVGVVNDIFEIIKDSSIKKDEIVAAMTEILMVMEENMVLDGYEEELDDCMGVDPMLDEAIKLFYEASFDPDMEENEDGDPLDEF